MQTTAFRGYDTNYLSSYITDVTFINITQNLTLFYLYFFLIYQLNALLYWSVLHVSLNLPTDKINT